MEMYPARVKALLTELCVELGFCLPPEAQRRIEMAPPADIDLFTDLVFREEGMDPHMPRNAHLRSQVRARVASHIEEFRRNIVP